MEVNVEGPIGAGRHEHSGECTIWRNGYGKRALDTRSGTLNLPVRSAVFRSVASANWCGRLLSGISKSTVSIDGSALPPWLASGRFPYLAHIGYMKVDEVAEGLEAGDGRLVRRQPLIDPGLRLAGPAVGVVAAKERLARVSHPFV